MKVEHTEVTWLTDHAEFSLAELADQSGVGEADLRELVDYGAIAPVNPEAEPWIFSGKCLLTVRTAIRLRVSFDLEPHGMALVVSLLDRIHALETQVTKLHAQLPSYIRQHEVPR